MKKKVHHFLNESKTGSFFLVFLIMFSIIIFSLQTEYPHSRTLEFLNVGILIIFAFEYCLRIWTSNHRVKYLTSFHGIIDLVAFLPALLIPAANGSIMLRLLRLSRLLQIMKIKAVTSGIKHVGSALKRSRAELLLTFSISVGFIFLGAVLMYLAEGELQPEVFGSIPRALWWSMATLTTVGYGDVYPITGLGKLIASLMAMVGIAAVALPAGILASAFTKTNED